jgi:hypothetical protein
MQALWSPEYKWLWTAALAIALFFPVRQLIWVLSVRRAERREGPTDETVRQKLKRRAAATAALLCFVFAIFYANKMFVAF